MNWKKLGFKKGNKALIENEMIFSHSGGYLEEVDIVHVGTKILKVRKGEERIIEFRGRQESGAVFGFMRTIYLNKNEYEEIQRKIKEKDENLEWIKNNLNKLNADALEEIANLMEDKYV